MFQKAILEIQKLPRPIAIIGMGITGDSVFQLLQHCQIPRSDLLLFDSNNQKSDFKTAVDLITTAQPKTLIVSPGVPLASAWLQDEIKKGTTITSELNLATLFLDSEKIVAITGSIGKSTTTCLIAEGLKSFLPYSFAGGNLGTPLATYVCELIENKRPRAPWLILELSSYQLENFQNLKADYGLITYFTANHLERYPTKESYYQSKWNLINHIKKGLFLNGTSEDLIQWSNNHKVELPITVTHRDSDIIIKNNLSQCALLGSHNLDNISMAAQFLNEIGAPPVAYAGLKSFTGLPHRLENLGFINGTRYVNDSKATTIESVITATQSILETVPSESTLWLLLGGKDKNLPWIEIQTLLKFKNVRYFFFGECGAKASSISQISGPIYAKLKELLPDLKHFVKAQDTVLLSPGGTSLDEFKSFEDRGTYFKNFLKTLN